MHLVISCQCMGVSVRQIRSIAVAAAMAVPLIALTSTLQAQQPWGPVFVFSEKILSETPLAALTTRPPSALCSPAFRANRIPISYTNGDDDLQVYINFTTAPLAGICALNYSIVIQFPTYVIIPSFHKRMFGELSLCQNEGVMTGPAYNLQTRLNDAFADVTQQCISEIEKKLAE